MRAGRWRVTWSRTRTLRPARAPATILGLALALLAALAPPAAGSEPSATIQPVLHVSPPGIRSLLVTTPDGPNPDLAASGCSPGSTEGIGFPNGVCSFGPVDITNGDAQSAIWVQATALSRDIAFTSSSNQIGPQVPILGGDGSGDTAAWQLCGVNAGTAVANGGEACNGPAGTGAVGHLPGTDQAWLRLVGGVDDPALAFSTTLGPDPTCDVARGTGSCFAPKNTERSETLSVVGPTSTTDDAYGMWTLVTFMALPPD